MHSLIACLCLIPSLAGQGSAKALWEARFDKGAEAWNVNQDVVDRTFANGAMRFRTNGADPILELKSPFNVPASPWQAIELTLSADRDGLAAIFWANSTEGPYGGFSEDKRIDFGIRGDGTMRTLRVFPFWQKAGRVVRLRFDPYADTRYSLESIRIVEVAPPGGGTTVIDFAKEPGAVQPLSGAASRSTPGGVTLTATQSDAVALARAPGVDSEALPVVSVRLASTTSRQASILFASDDVFGLQALPFPIIGDGRARVYNVDMLAHPSWRGKIVALGVRPGDKAGAASTVNWLRVSDKAQGPADLRILSFQVEDALPRTGMPITLTARVGNAGGDAARDIRATASFASGAEVKPLSAPAGTSLSFGQEATWKWQVTFAKPTSASASLRVTAANAPGASATCAARVTPRIGVRPQGVMPAPDRVSGKIEVGVYYFPGWRGPGQWAPITRFPERRPVLGWYREGEPSVADWHVKWAVEHGITFFAYDWYWSAGARSLEHALHDGLFKSEYGEQLKFCLLWANHNGPGTSSHEDFMAVVKYWIDNYFKRPNHYMIDGKPAVIIFTPHRFRADMGSVAVRRSFDAMRKECRKAGLKGLYILACVGGDRSELRAAADEGYDAVTAYNWPGLGMKGTERWSPFDDLLAPFADMWKSVARESTLPIMTPVCAGWDSRPWHGDTAMVRSGRNPANFKRHLQDAKRFIEAKPGKALPVALIEAWNELGEGSYIEPQKEFGFGYLDAIREVFTDAPAAHVDVTPADAGVAVPQVDVGAGSSGVWRFRTDPLGWESGMDIADARIEDEALTVRTTGRDPAFFGPPIQIPAAQRTELSVRMRLTGGAGSPAVDTAQIFWSTRGGSTSEAASARFEVRLDGQWHDYRAPLAGNARWRGVVTALRFDPCNLAGVKVQVAAMELAP